MRMTNKIKNDIVQTVAQRYGVDSTVSKNDIKNVANEFGIDHVSTSWIKDARISHGKYSLKMIAQLNDIVIDTNKNINSPVNNIVEFPSVVQSVNLVPEVDPLYVPTEWFDAIHSIVSQNRFFPVYITGQSGNGKSKTVVQACAAAGRELIRINVTAGTDAEELIGHQTLKVDPVTGQTITHYQKGPIVEAMERGAVVLIDEIDLLNPNKAGELYTTLEGAGIFIKATNEQIVPKEGFNIIATANTTGQGDDDGRYIGTGILSEAFLERFPITLRFDYPDKAMERKIINKLFKSLGLTSPEDKEFASKILDWVTVIRNSFAEGATEQVITTRRTVAIIEAYSIFRDRKTAISMCISRFDSETRESFLDLYSKVDASINGDPEHGDSQPEMGQISQLLGN